MGRDMLIEGEWRTDVEPKVTETGEYDRATTTFRDWIRDETGAKFQPEANRYHLYLSWGCPWSHGAGLTRRLAGLVDAISLDVLNNLRDGEGWQFTPEKEGYTADTVNGSRYLREVYTKAEPNYTGRVSVPVLWDKEHETIVNNESIEIMRMLAAEFGDVGEEGADLYPEGYRDEIDRIIDELYDDVNNGVFRAGFAESQEAYESAVDDVFTALDHWDAVLADQRYLAGGRMTLADVRMFPTLIRFDEVYHTLFKCNVRRIEDYDHLWPYLRDLYQTPGFSETVRWEFIKDGYRAHGDGIIPVGPDPDFEAPHDRDRLPGSPPEALYEK